MGAENFRLWKLWSPYNRCRATVTVDGLESKLMGVEIQWDSRSWTNSINAAREAPLE